MPITSYFNVKDTAAFLEWVDSIPDLQAHCRTPGRKGKQPLNLTATRLWRLSYPGNEWLVPNALTGEFVDLQEEVLPYLADDTVVVFKETYQVGNRLHGNAVAVHSSGGLVKLSLDDIYSLARERFAGATIMPEEDY